jgi:hypothetical protein
MSHAPARPAHASKSGKTQHDAPTRAAKAAVMPSPDSSFGMGACMCLLITDGPVVARIPRADRRRLMSGNGVTFTVAKSLADRKKLTHTDRRASCFKLAMMFGVVYVVASELRASNDTQERRPPFVQFERRDAVRGYLPKTRWHLRLRRVSPGSRRWPRLVRDWNLFHEIVREPNGCLGECKSNYPMA